MTRQMKAKVKNKGILSKSKSLSSGGGLVLYFVMSLAMRK
jgi:hypothetical protein